MNLADKIRQRREALGLSKQQAARRAEVTWGNWHAYEQGRIAPTLATLERIAAALEWPLADLVS